MSLADSIYEASNPERGPKSLLTQLVGKAMAKSIAGRPDQYSVYQLHLRGDEVWNGHERVEETQQNVYLLTEWEEKIPQPILIIFWSRLKEKLPVLDTNYIQISDNLLWDKTNGEIINIKEEYEDQTPTPKLETDQEASEDSGSGLSGEDEMEERA